MRIVIAGGHGKIALALERILAERGDQAVGLIRNPAHVADVGRVSDQPYGLVAAPGEQALQQECDLPVPTRDHYTHAVSLRTGITPAAWLRSRICIQPWMY